jgi:hypothetical protein
MAYHNINSKNDRALMAFIIAQGAGTAADVFPAKRSLGKTVNHTVCWSETAVETVPYSGTYTIATSIMVKCLSPDDGATGAARLTSDQRTAATFDLFFTNVNSSGNSLADLITTAARALAVSDPTNHADLADYTCQDVSVKGPETGFDQDVWVETLNLSIVACPKNVSD